MRCGSVARSAGLLVVGAVLTGCSAPMPTPPPPVADVRPAVKPAPQIAQCDGHISADDVIAWTIRGLDDSTIIERIRHGNTVFKVSAAVETKLHDAGVSDGVVRALKSTIWD